MIKIIDDFEKERKAVSELFSSNKLDWDTSEIYFYSENRGLLLGYYLYNKLIGFCVLDDKELRFLCVAANYHNVGIGTNLVNYCLELGLQNVNCFVNMVTFYASLGFVVNRTLMLQGDNYKEKYRNKRVYYMTPKKLITKE